MSSPAVAGRVFAAVDVGASGGRVIAGIVDPDASGVQLHTVHRFPNAMYSAGGHLHWDIRTLYAEVLAGLAQLARRFPSVESIGIDTWAVDYALVDTEGALLADPYAYRDDRTAQAVGRVHRLVDPIELYRINGLQHLPFTTIYQLAAEQDGPMWAGAEHAVLLPDLLAFWLTGVLRTEYTNASTTGLIDVTRHGWSSSLHDRLSIPSTLFAPIDEPGQIRGNLLADVATGLGLGTGVVVTTVGSHDTASAVVGVPATGTRFAYIASGTWSLVGVELDRPVLDDAARRSNFTNEAGVGGRTRFLRNVGGLWLLQESMRTWADEGPEPDLSRLLAEASPISPTSPVVDVDDPSLIAPGDMPGRIRDAAAAGGGRVESRAEITACIIESLATAYATTVAEAAALSGCAVDVIHIVGGGSQNELLCRRTAARTGLVVVAGPVEATALGNVCVQAMAGGALPDDLDAVRAILAGCVDVVTYLPGESSTRPESVIRS